MRFCEAVPVVGAVCFLEWLVSRRLYPLILGCFVLFDVIGSGKYISRLPFLWCLVLKWILFF